MHRQKRYPDFREPFIRTTSSTTTTDQKGTFHGFTTPSQNTWHPFPLSMAKHESLWFINQWKPGEEMAELSKKIKKPLPVALGTASSRCDTSAPASPTTSPSQEEFGIWYRARSKTQLNKDLTAFAHLHEVCLGLMIFTQLPARAARRTRG